MEYAVTTNELSISHGHSPINKKTVEKFKRGFFVYITEFDKRLGYTDAINSRIGYYDYDCEIKNSNDLEKLVIEKGRLGELKSHIRGPNNEFPLLRTNLGQIDFGWDPCDVSYILDISGWSFQDLTVNDKPSGLNQPMVFRKNKIINKNSIDYKIHSFLENKCFYNLEVENTENISILRFSNYMLDKDGIKILYDQCDKREWHYCIDMHIQIKQNTYNFRKILSTTIDEKNVDSIIEMIEKYYVADARDKKDQSIYKLEAGVFTVDSPSNLPEFLTIVFDPPNCNGGGSGPPKMS